MRNIKKTKCLVVLIVCGILHSCNDFTLIDEIDSTVVKNDFTISKSIALEIAVNYSFKRTKEKIGEKSFTKTPIKNQKKIKSILEVPDKDELTAYYIINYQGGGFIILAGDKRSEPILAFSEDGEFDFEADYYPSGLVGWLYSSKEAIERIREKNEIINPNIERLWRNFYLDKLNTTTNRGDDEEEEEEDCNPYYIQKGPFLSTKWGQGCGFNSHLPSMSCGPCGYASAGCVAVAMAQIMKYHQHPSRYSWSFMFNTIGTNSASILIRDIGEAVDMNYKCLNSIADTRSKIARAFKNDFGYSSAIYSGYYFLTLKSELNNGRPVILRGGRKVGSWIFAKYKDGHAWVCDGYLSHIYPCWGSTLKLRMNWGWEGDYNGWYSYDNFNPAGQTFNYETGMVYNIIP